MTGKHLKRFAEQTPGMVFNPNPVAAYGDYQGYQVVIQGYLNENQYIITWAVTGGMMADQPANINQYLVSLGTGRPYFNYARYEKSTITVNIRHKGEDVEHLTDILNQVTAFCRNNGMTTCCKYCGSPSGLGVYNINGRVEAMCTSCFGQVQVNLQQAQAAIKQKKANIPGGILGAFLGSLVGVALWIALYQMGYIAGIVGLVYTFLAMKGYQKFGGKLDKTGLILSLVIAAVMLFVGEMAALLVTIASSFPVDFGQAMQLLGYLLQDGEIQSTVIGELAMGYFFAALASVSTIISVYREANLKHEVRRLG